MNLTTSNKTISVFIVCVFSFTLSQSFAQQSKIDSLLSVLNSSKVDTTKVNTLYYLAEANTDDAKYGKAIEYARQGIKLSEEIKFKKGVSICLNALGLAYYNMGKFDTALIQFEKRYEIVKSMKDSFAIASTCDNMAMIFIHFGNNTKALGLRERANNIYIQQNKMSHLASGFVWIGEIYKGQAEYSMALENYLKALKIYDQENDEKSIGYPLINISSIYRYMKQYEMAKKYAYKARDAFEKSNNKRGVGVSLYRTALISLEEKEYDLSIEYLVDAKIIFEEIQDEYSLVLVIQSLGNCYREKGENIKALDYFKMANTNAEEIGDKELIAASIQQLSTIYHVNGDYLKAIEFSKKAEKLYIELNNKLVLQQISQNYIEIYSHLNKPDSVIKYFQSYQSLSDSIFSEQNSHSIAEMQTKYETEKKEKELEISTIKIHKQKSNVILLTIIILILVVNSAAMFYVHRKKLQKNLLLAKSQLQLAQLQEAEIKNRLRNTVSDLTSKNILEKLVYEIETAKCFLDADLNINTLSLRVGTNREYLSQIIHKTFEKNFNEFINQYRVNEAIEILKKIAGGEQPNWTMQLVAENSGFKYTSTFNPAFKAAMKMSPAEFKKTLKNHNISL